MEMIDNNAAFITKNEILKIKMITKTNSVVLILLLPIFYILYKFYDHYHKNLEDCSKVSKDLYDCKKKDPTNCCLDLTRCRERKKELKNKVIEFRAKNIERQQKKLPPLTIKTKVKDVAPIIPTKAHVYTT